MKFKTLVATALAVAGCGGDGVHHLPPDTVIDSKPDALTNKTHSVFQFHPDGIAEGFRCTVDGTGSDCTPPFEIDLAEGMHHFEVAAIGRDSDDGTPATYDWQIDTTPPDTTITTAPANPDNSTTENFGFDGTDGTVSFECAVDGAAFAACTSPMPVTVSDGNHAFRVRALDAAGNADPTPAEHAWILDTSTPDTAIVTGPNDAATTGPNVSFTFSSPDPGATFECSLDGAAFTDCTSPLAATLGDGAHTFTVRAKNDHGFTDPSPATRAWTVDAIAPDAIIDTHPTALSNDPAPSFTFHSPDTTATFACALDAGAFTACSSPKSFAVSDGNHTFHVRATDPVGNQGGEQTFAWTVDATAPTVNITGGPTGATNDTTPTFAFTTAGSPTVVQCRVDTGTFAACTSPVTTAALGDGNHTFEVKVSDAAGNASNATRAFSIDTAAPVVTILTTPTNPTNQTTASFTFATTEGALTCKLDAGAFAACTSPKAFTGLAEGNHTFTVVATDVAGNAGTASFTWTIDTTAPTVSITSGPTGPTNVTTPSFAFTTAGSPTTVQCRMDAGTFAACTSPFTSAALGNGNHTFEVKVADAAGNSNSATRTFSVDTVAPVVTFTSTPTNPTNQTTATFAFTTTEGTTTCKLDAGSAAACTSPKAFTGLAAGSHTLVVTATDAAGNFGSASFTWTIDTTGPTVTLTSTPSNPSNLTTATFGFTTTDGALACKLDGGAFAACTSPKTFTGLAAGSHTFTAQATDGAGNTGSASFTWTIDTTGPTVQITSTPTNPSSQSSATFGFTTTEGALSCKLDGGAFAACTSPKAFTGLADGSHTFTAQAVDGAGNTGSASFTWTIDTVKPVVTIASGPSNPSNVATASFVFSTTEGALSCKLDTGSFAACTSPKAFTGLADGSHTFTAQATDGAGNTGSASFTWTIDTGAPVVTITSSPSNPSNSRTATFGFTTTEGTLTCQLDGGGFSACASPKAFTGLADGSHTFIVQAKDGAGNTGTATKTWVIDATAPSVVFDAVPPASWPVNYFDAQFHSDDPTATFTCSVNGAAAVACSSPFSLTTTYGTLSKLTVAASDALGNSSSKTATWTSVPGLVLHYPYEQGSTKNTSLLAQVPDLSPDGSLATLADVGGWAGTALASPKRHGYKQTIRPLASSVDGHYTASVWIRPGANDNGVIWTNATASNGLTLRAEGSVVTLTALEDGTSFTARQSISHFEWINVAVTSSGSGTGVSLWVNGALIQTIGKKTGFDKDQADDLVVGDLGGTDVDDLRFYNVGFSAAQMCSVIARGATDPNGGCIANRPVFELDFENNFVNTGFGHHPVTQPKSSTFVAGTMGLAVQLLGQSGGFNITQLSSLLVALPEHSFTFWTSIDDKSVDDRLIDFTGQCGNFACGPVVTYISKPQPTLRFHIATSSGFVKDIDIPVSFGTHTVVVTEQRNVDQTQSVTLFVDGGNQTFIPINSGNLFTQANDRVEFAGLGGTTVDEYEFWPRDLSKDPEMLCENGFDGEFDAVTGQCSLTSN